MTVNELIKELERIPEKYRTMPVVNEVTLWRSGDDIASLYSKRCCVGWNQDCITIYSNIYLDKDCGQYD